MNIATLTISSDRYIELEAEIKKTVPSFSFVDGKTYTIQVRGSAKVCEKDSEPDSLEGFRIPFTKPFTYVPAGSKLWVAKANILKNTVINVAE